MPIYGRHFEPGQLQFITTSTYRRVPVFAIPGSPQLFLEALRAARSKFGFLLVGWVSCLSIFICSSSPSRRKHPRNEEGIETGRWPQLLNRQSAILKSAIGRLAWVNLEVLLLGKPRDAGNGPDRMNCRAS
jgi:hypothetical protein